MNFVAGRFVSRLLHLGVLLICVIFTLGIADPTPRFLGISGTESSDDITASAPLTERPVEGVSAALRDPGPPVRASAPSADREHHLRPRIALLLDLVVRAGSGPPLRC